MDNYSKDIKINNTLNNLLIPYRKTNKWGYANLHKELIVQPIYKSVDTFYNGFGKVEIEYNKIGILNSNGNEVVPVIYKYVSLVQGDSIFIVKDQNNKYGLYSNGKIIFDCIYEYIIYKNDELFLVNIDKKWMFIDINKKELFPKVELKSYNFPAPDSIICKTKLIDNRTIIHEHFGSHVFIDSIKKDLKFQIRDIKEIKTKNKRIYYASYYTKHKREDEFHSYIFYDSEFEILFPKDDFNFLKIYGLIYYNEEEDFIIVEDERRNSYLIDESFKSIIKLNFQVDGNFYEGLAPAKKNIDGKTRIGFVNKNLEIVIPFVFNSVKAFRNGLCKVQKDGLYGIVDNLGNIIIPFLYKKMGDICDEKIAVTFNDNFSNSCGFINLKNQIISDINYSFYYGGPYFNKYGVAVVNQVSKGFGLINRSGIEILECKYSIDDNSFYDGFSIISKDGKYGVINYIGEIIIEIKYKKIYRKYKMASCNFWDVVSENEDYIGYVDQFGNEFWED